MYGMFGGCTSLLHLAIQFPKITMMLGLAGMLHLLTIQAPGQMLGTEDVLRAAQAKIEQKHGGLDAKMLSLHDDFSKVYAEPTEEQVKTVLGYTDACTDRTVKDILSDPDMSREVAWLYFLDTYSREGPEKAEKLFIRPRGHTTAQLKE
jgi:hypothetical protein